MEPGHAKVGTRRSLRPTTGMVIGLLLVSAFGPLLLGPVAADEGASAEDAQLPEGRDALSAVWTGSQAFLFGGANGGNHRDTIIRFDPSTGSVQVMGARLPSGRSGTAAVWTGEHAFVFGGTDNGLARLDEIVRYNPSTDTATRMGGKLPVALGALAAVWTGTHAFVFGGSTPNDQKDLILRYDPVADQVVTMGAKLPSARGTLSAVWTGTYAYIFGGAEQGGQYLADVLRYDPATDTLEVMGGKLPTPRTGTSAAWTGREALVFGGTKPAATEVDQIVSYDPAEDRSVVRPVTLPSARRNTAAVWADGSAFVFGGYGGQFLREIVRYTLPDPFLPRDLTAFAGPGQGAVSLGWEGAPGVVGDPVLSYRVYRGDAPGQEVLLATVPATQTTFVDTPPDPVRTSYYLVRAIHGAGESEPSNRACSAGWPFHLLPSLQAPCDAPPGWVGHQVLQERVPIIADLLEDPVLATVDGRPDPADASRYIIDITAGGIPLPTIGFYTAGIAMAPIHLVVPNLLHVDELIVTIEARRDPSQGVCLVSVGTQCFADSPIRLDPDWLLRRGVKSEVIVALTSEVEGEPGAVDYYVRIPHLGQLVDLDTTVDVP